MSKILLLLLLLCSSLSPKFVIHGHLRLYLSGPLYCHSDGKQSDSHSRRARVGSLEVARFHKYYKQISSHCHNTICTPKLEYVDISSPLRTCRETRERRIFCRGRVITIAAARCVCLSLCRPPGLGFKGVVIDLQHHFETYPTTKICQNILTKSTTML